jgi:hypothetical protein
MAGDDRGPLLSGSQAGGSGAEHLACLACGVARLSGYAPVFFAAAGLAGGQVFMQAGDLLLAGGEGFDRHQGLLAQFSGPFDRLGRVGQPCCQASFGLSGGPVDLCLLALAACLLPPHHFFLAVNSVAAAGQQGTGSLDGRQRALLQVFDGHAQLLAPLIQFTLPIVEFALALIQLGFPLISCPFPLVGLPLPRIGPGFTLVGSALPLLGQLLPRVGPELALIGRTLPGSLGLQLSGRGGP